MTFKTFRNMMQTKFATISNQPIFKTNIPGDDLYKLYLDSFPTGTNPIYITRTEHDCFCCKQFIRTIGNVIIIKDGQRDTLWNIPGLQTPYKEVATALHNQIIKADITSIFYHYEKSIGTSKNYQNTENGIITWNHFQLTLPNLSVLPKDSIGTSIGNSITKFQVFHRALTEITPESIQIVSDLISDNNLIRGEEKLDLIRTFKDIKNKFDILPRHRQDDFAWLQTTKQSTALTHIRNSSIGTLLTDLSNNIDLETAVKKYESKVAPENYRRPKPLVTKKMLENAQEKLTSLGYIESLYRRPAIETDLNINDLYWASATTTAKITNNPFEELIETLPTKPPSHDRLNTINITDFINNVLPTTNKIELFMENRHINNLASIIGPQNATAPSMFAWNNAFSWTYNNNMADSIKERVKSAGGCIDAYFRASLAWHNTDDLDISIIEPNGNIIYYVNKLSKFTKATLDIDANAGTQPITRTPVENIVYQNATNMLSGEYQIIIHNYAQRESIDTGFEIELAYNNEEIQLVYDKPIKDDEKIKVATFHYDPTTGIKIKPLIKKGNTSKKIWNLTTQTYCPVKLVTVSPNYWKPNKIGNKHYFFILENCKFDTSLRGFFNEYLHPDLREHRKVFEILGDKMKCQPTDTAQLSGLGFSSTQRNSITAKISGSHTRMMNITF